MKIAVIFTGGTIGSTYNQSSVGLSRTSRFLLLKNYQTADIVFDTYEAVNILSENITVCDIKTIINSIKKVESSQKYDGIILTHGTDTIAYTSGFLSLFFANIRLPLVLVSANFPLEDARSNGYANFDGAIAFIKQKINGVFVSYTNRGEDTKIHLASRLVPMSEMNDKLQSLFDEHFAYIKDGIVTINTSNLLTSIDNLTNNTKNINFTDISNDILIIKASALTNFNLYNFDIAKPKAIIIESYHSGTICKNGSNTDVLSFINYCKQKDVTVIIASVSSDANIYDGSDEVYNSCIVDYDSSLTMTIVKTMTAIGSKLDIKDVINGNFYYEKIIK